MKTFLLAASLLFLTGSAVAQSSEWRHIIQENKHLPFSEICLKIEDYFKQNAAHEKERSTEKEEEGSAYNKYQKWKYFNQFRLTEDGYLPTPKDVLEAFANEKSRLKVDRSAECDWSYIDQMDNDGGYWGIGRTTGVTFHPTDDQLFYVTSPGGGVWKTTDGGQTYTSSDDGLPYGACSNLVMDPTNTDVLYVVNGDPFSWWQSCTGVYKSTDGGITWLPTTLAFSLNQTVIQELKMSPTDPQILFAATTDGLYKTTDGGLNWGIARSGEYTSVAFKPNDGTTIYAAASNGTDQVFKSVDTGITWTQITTFNMGSNFIRLSTTQLDAERLLISCSDNTLYQTTDAGTTITQLGATPENEIVCYSPQDTNTLYCGYVVLYRSTDGGMSWNQITDWWNSGEYTEIHADFDEFAYSNNTNDIYFCNDGGLYKYDETNDQWSDLSNGLQIGQFYRIINAGNNDMVLLGGTQDNGGRKRAPNGDWINENGGDGMEVAMNPDDYYEYYTCYINGTGLERTSNGGGTRVNIYNNIPGNPVGQWVTPYDMDPQSAESLVAGYNRIYRTDNKGANWYELGINLANSNEGVVDIELSHYDVDVVYASYSDKFLKTTDSGQNWDNINLPGTQPITRITTDPTNDDHIWVTRGGYTAGTKVTRSIDGGETWTDYSEGLPNVPHNVIIFEPNSPGRLYVGNDFGVYFRDSLMEAWELYGNGLPITFVNDLDIAPTAQKLRAGTFGRGIWEADLCATSIAGVSEEGVAHTYAFIYPNPSKGEFALIQKTVHSLKDIQLTDLNGRKVPFTLNTLSGITTVKTTVPAGVYLLSYTANGTVYSEKLTVE